MTEDNLKDETAKANLVKCIVNGSALTQEQIDNRTSDYVCWDCGIQFLTEAQKKREGVVTAHKSICGLCREDKSVTHIRHWNWLHCH